MVSDPDAEVIHEHGYTMMKTSFIRRAMPWTFLLDQDVEWYDREGARHLIVEMTDSHRRNTAAFLRRRASWLHARVGEEMFLGPLSAQGEMAMDAEERAMYEWWEMDPLEWLNGEKLLIALGMEDTSWAFPT